MWQQEKSGPGPAFFLFGYASVLAALTARLTRPFAVVGEVAGILVARALLALVLLPLFLAHLHGGGTALAVVALLVSHTSQV